MSNAQLTFYFVKCQKTSPSDTSKPLCVKSKSQNLSQHLEKALKQKGIQGTVELIQSDCLNRCSEGPFILIEPGYYIYAGLNEEKLDRIIDEHIIGGNIVTEYLLHDGLWEEIITPSGITG